MQTSALTLESSFSSYGDYYIAGNVVGFRVATVPAVLLGDFNGDGRVDAADYIAWRKTDGTPAGFNAWRTHFGQTTGSGAAATGTANPSISAVPEPGSLGLLGLAIAAVLCRFRSVAKAVRLVDRTESRRFTASKQSGR